MGWDTKERLRFLQEELDKLMEELVQPPKDKYVPNGMKVEIPVDFYETEDDLHVRAELPGMEKDAINIYFSRDLLSIEGMKDARYKDGQSFHNIEREFGKFKRDIPIPKAVDGTKIEAKLVDGVLCIKLPKIKDRRGKPKRVALEIEE